MPWTFSKIYKLQLTMTFSCTGTEELEQRRQKIKNRNKPENTTVTGIMVSAKSFEKGYCSW